MKCSPAHGHSHHLGGGVFGAWTVPGAAGLRHWIARPFYRAIPWPGFAAYIDVFHGGQLLTAGECFALARHRAVSTRRRSGYARAGNGRANPRAHAAQSARRLLSPARLRQGGRSICWWLPIRGPRRNTSSAACCICTCGIPSPRGTIWKRTCGCPDFRFAPKSSSTSAPCAAIRRA